MSARPDDLLDRAAAVVDRFWKLAAAGCLGLAALVAVIAFASQPTERDGDQVRNVLRDFVTAAGDRDGDTACRLLSPAGRQAVTAVVPGVTCQTYARSFGFDVAGLGSVQVNLPENLPDRVVIDASNTVGPDGQPVQRRVAMSRTGDGYRIDALTR